jgi:hypothetical protein
MKMLFFKQLKQNDPQGFELIKDLVDNYIKECREQYGIKYEI